MRNNLIQLLGCALYAAKAAGEEILKIYAQRDINLAYKGDGSPVTNADLIANIVINKILQSSGLPVVSEEAFVPYEKRSDWQQFWLIDPLDGTKDFIARNDEFCVNIALIEEGYPVIGVIAAPALNKIWYAARGSGAWAISSGKKMQINALAPWPLSPRMFTSRFHDSEASREFSRMNGVQICIPTGASIKLARIAASEAEFYPRFAGTSEWDVAAGDAILREAGAELRAISGQLINYNTPKMRNPFFVAWRPPVKWEDIKFDSA
jgi:3'(2'), 5'-bisphosphate nucleotidase